jgi:hypothetical protein
MRAEEDAAVDGDPAIDFKCRRRDLEREMDGWWSVMAGWLATRSSSN